MTAAAIRREADGAPTANPEVIEDSLVVEKENASMVNSSLTECKHEVNFDGLESSINKDNEECNASTEERLHSFVDGVGSSLMKNDKGHTRYFIIKSLSHQNIHLSVEKGIWATQVMNEPILEEAFHSSDRVILIFSVNMSGFFQGYAQMMSSVSWRRDNVWSKSTGGSNPWGRTFKIKWLRLCDLPFQKTLHLKNPLNDYKPVKISRDCQELSADIGDALCRLFDGEVDIKGKLKRNNSSVDDILVEGDNSLKRPWRSSPVHFEHEGFMLSVSPHMRWAGPTMLHPSLMYQHVQHEEHNHAHRIHSNMQGSRNKLLQLNKKDMAHGRNLAAPLSDEDILDMTYEEYLQVVGRNSYLSLHPASIGSTWEPAGYADK